MHVQRRFFWPFIVILLFLSAACTLLLDRSKEQCSNDGDCTSKFGAGAICRDSVCTKDDGGAIIDSGSDVLTTDGNDVVPDSGSDARGPDADASFGQDGCVYVIP